MVTGCFCLAGLFVFSDIMQRDCVDTTQLAAVYARIGLEDMGSPARYIQVQRQRQQRLDAIWCWPER